MKTVIVLYSLTIFASAVPTLPRGNFDNINTGLDSILEGIIREKKSLIQDTPQELTVDHGQETQQLCNSKKSQLEASSLDKKNIGIRKPIIIKKKFGYHVYQDSDEEMAHADPNENCRKQVKVKLCDTEPVLHTHSNNIKSITSEGSQATISEKEMENSIKTAKEAVENLQRDLRKMELGKIGNSKESLESNIELQNDIENARKALDHIHHNIGNFESMDFQLNDPKKEDTEMNPKDVERLNQWKEAIENIHKNFEIAKNIENAFQLDTQNVLPSEHKKDKIKDENLAEEEEKPENSNNTPKENEENDMFVSTTEPKESKIKLHSDSLTSEIFDNVSSGRGETKAIDDHTDDHLITMKSSEKLPKNMAFEIEKTIPNDMSQLESKAANDIAMLPLQHNKQEKEVVFQVENNEDDKNLHKSLAKSVKEKDQSERSLSTHQNEQLSHELSMRSGALNVNLINLESNHLIGEKDASEIKIEEPKATEVTQNIKTRQLNEESIGSNYNQLNMRASDDAMTFMEGDEKKNENHLPPSMSEINLPSQKSANNLQSELLKNLNDKNDLTEFSNELSTLRKDGSHQNLKEVQSNSKEFSSMRTNENKNIDHFLIENHEMKNFPLKHFNQEENVQTTKSVSEFENEHLVPNKKDESTKWANVKKEEINARTNKNPSEEEKLNDKQEIHEPVLSRLAQDKQLKDNLMQFKSMASHNMHTINLPTNTNEFKNEQQMFNEPTTIRVSEKHETRQHLHDNLGLQEQLSLVSDRRPLDHSMQNFKSFDFHNEDLVPSNGFKEGQTGPSMRLIEGKNFEDLDESPINNPLLMHWAQGKENEDHFSLNDHMMQAQAKTNGFHNEHTLREHMNMRMTEDHNSGQQFIDSHELYDPISMRWAEDHQNTNQMTHSFDNTAEFHNEPHINDHLHEHITGSRFNNHFDLHSGHDFSPMNSRMHSHSNMMKHAKPSDIDSAVQPSMHIGMRDSNMQWGHHHHGMARTSGYPSNLPMTAGSPDAVGVFPNANTGCSIPLLLSCSPSIVSGTMAKARPTAATPNSAYRSGDDFMFYMKRDINNFNGVPSIKTNNLAIPFNHKMS